MKNLLLLFIILSTFGCAPSSEKEGGGKPHIVTTTGMLEDIVKNIGGEYVTTESIMGPGVDPHLYKASQGDLRKLQSADAIVYNGLLLEGKMGEILGKLGRGKPVFAAAKLIPKDKLLGSVQYENAYDPHIWFDVSLWKTASTGVYDIIAELDTSHIPQFKENTKRYLSSLDSLDRWVKTQIQLIPEQQRILVTAHDAFRYFGRAYHIRVEGLQGISTVSDPGLRDVTNLTSLIIENNIKAIFVETSVSDKSIKAVVDGCQNQGHNVKIGGYLYSDAMGEPGTPEGTYRGMVISNVNTIVDNLK